MKIKKEDPSKVIVIPRPPRSANQELRPINPLDAASEEEDVEQPESHDQPIEAVGPGCGPMNNQVEGPAAGLAGVQATEAPAEESAEEE